MKSHQEEGPGLLNVIIRLHEVISDCILTHSLQEGTTALILASANNHIEIVKELLSKGADPNSRRKVKHNTVSG